MTSQPAHAADLAATPGVIPYVDHHTGPRRLLVIDLKGGDSRLADRFRPIASIDGRQYVVVWGQVSWEIPADRNVHISVHLQHDSFVQAASMILPPGEAPAMLAYKTQGSGFGSLT